MKRAMLLTFAAGVTAAALAMATASAWQRAETTLDRWLLASVSCAIVLAVHLLPALLRRTFVMWTVWTLCLAGALWSHSTFLASAWQGAAEARSATSAQARNIEERRAQIEANLAAIKARPAGQIARQLSWTKSEEQASALRIELEEAQRATRLRDDLLALTVTREVTAVTDPLLARVTAVTGVPAAAISLAVSVGQAVLVEVLGMLLWLGALVTSRPARQPEQNGTNETQLVELMPAALPSDLERLRAAVERGQCALRVADIRAYLKVGTKRAQALRRELEPADKSTN